MGIEDFKGRALRLLGYVHGIRAGDDVGRWNVGLSGRLCSVDATAEIGGWDDATHARARDVPIDVLREAAHTLGGAPSARGLALWQASLLRMGYEVGFGAPPHVFTPLSEEDARKALARVELELEGEHIRRRCARDAPSRLSCLWIADDDAAGRSYVERILGRESFLLPVAITYAIRAARVDAAWLAGSSGSLTVADWEGYWSGEETGEREAVWETLLDGCIEGTDDESLARLRCYGQLHPPFTS